MFKFDENIHESNVPVKYVFEEGHLHKKHLVVVFAGFHDANANPPYKYNYIRSLRNIDCHRLFILDNYGPRGCYYIGGNGSCEFETSVNSLIMSISRKYDIRPENIITAGSSKGGSAALYYGLKYNYGSIIAGAPQTRIADYVGKFAKETSDYMLGENPSEEKVAWLNNIISVQLNHEILSDIYILTSENDSQYSKHIKPFQNEMDSKGIKYHMDVDNNIQHHNDIAGHFPDYLYKNLLQIMHGIKIRKLSINKNGDNRLIQTQLETETMVTSKIVIKHEDTILSEMPINGQLEFNITNLKIKGTKVLDIALVIEKSGNNVLTIPIETFLSSNGNVLRGVSLDVKDDNLKFQIDIDRSSDLEYAFYIRRNNAVIEKIMYQPSNTLEYPISDKGNYQIHYFIRSKKEKVKYSNRSQMVKI
ncbi:hypothetical protein LG298_23800 [Cytobacillus firmus]|uniref:hypothetical protein n=1 Tax=Cytobacillus firmus TaxID=1399 RepID=UPI00384CFF1D